MPQFLDKEAIVPSPWMELEAMMNKLDQETIDKVNSFYNEKKIIKSPKLTDKETIDRWFMQLWFVNTGLLIYGFTIFK